MKKKDKITPSQFYRWKRPEYFSDSQVSYEVLLPKEVLAFELEKITTNQKEAHFEILCRRFAEKLICPNLIPQVGPTGGGDGKTDSETFPVSSEISYRWFIPENGWDKDEKWAFAFSAKKNWKEKLIKDIKSILSTEREYTRIYFITNQKPSSKIKKDEQDKIKKLYKMDVVILDGEWILSKAYSNDLIDIAVDSLSLSEVYKNKKVKLGSNDSERLKSLDNLEKNISNPKRYQEVDYQLFEDALESAILSRMVEKSRDEIEGKFDRAIRICKKINNPKHWVRVYYQRAWTYINWYDDYQLFIDDFRNFKSYLSSTSHIHEAELYFNLINLIKGLENNYECELSKYGINLEQEIEEFNEFVTIFEDNELKPCSSIMAKLYKTIHCLGDAIINKEDTKEYIELIQQYFLKTKNFLDFPFDSYKELIEVYGKILPNDSAYDNLIDVIASIAGERSSDLSAAFIFLKRAAQKMEGNFYKESIIYFGKSVVKFAKEESQNELYLALTGLSSAYSSLGLAWATNNCLIAAGGISLNLFYQKGIVHKRAFDSIKGLMQNELFIGRIPSFLAWHELLCVLDRVIENQGDLEKNKDDLFAITDACLAIRLLHTKFDETIFPHLPDLLESQSLYLAQDAALYQLGYYENILNLTSGIKMKTNEDLDKYFNKFAKQPFVEQMLYETNFLAAETIHLISKILGCEFEIIIEHDADLVLVAELFLAFFESFLATGLSDVTPVREKILLNVKNMPSNTEPIIYKNLDISRIYEIEVCLPFFLTNNIDKIQDGLFRLIAHIISYNFYFENSDKYLSALFNDEEVAQRLSLVLNHRKFSMDVLGGSEKLLFKNWTKDKGFKKYPMKRIEPIIFDAKKYAKPLDFKDDFDTDTVGHNKRKVISIIEVDLWDKALWRAFGFFLQNGYLGVALAFENQEYGLKIFDEWVKKYGKEDNDDKIRIAIIRGVNKENPNWYRVHVSPNFDKENFDSANLYISVTRFHELNADSSSNLDSLLNYFSYFRRFILCPANIADGKGFEPFIGNGIMKTHLHIRNAWEIGIHDTDALAIKKDDNPVIPSHVKEAPVLELLKYKNNQRDK